MSGSEFIIEGLDEAEQALTEMIERDYPEAFKNIVIQIAWELQGRVKEHTPVDTSYLQDRWFVGDLIKTGTTYYIEVYNNVEYALHVEEGHRKRRNKNGESKGFVKGAHMMKLSLEEVNKRLTPFLQDWLSNFLDTHEVF